MIFRVKTQSPPNSSHSQNTKAQLGKKIFTMDKIQSWSTRVTWCANKNIILIHSICSTGIYFVSWNRFELSDFINIHGILILCFVLRDICQSAFEWFLKQSAYIQKKTYVFGKGPNCPHNLKHCGKKSHRTFYLIYMI